MIDLTNLSKEELISLRNDASKKIKNLKRRKVIEYVDIEYSSNSTFHLYETNLGIYFFLLVSNHVNNDVSKYQVVMLNTQNILSRWTNVITGDNTDVGTIKILKKDLGYIENLKFYKSVKNTISIGV